MSPPLPRKPLPAGSCDSHLHVFGDPAAYPLDPRRNYSPPLATLAAYREVMAACGIERAVLVQPSVYGTDNRCLLDALREANDEGSSAFRGVVVPDAAIDDGELEAMHALGVRGIRLNLVNPQMLGVDAALSLCERMRHRGWNLQLQLSLSAEGEVLLAGLAERSDVPLVIDHLGRPPAGVLPRTLLALLTSGRIWVKLSAPYRTSRAAAPAYADLQPLVDAMLEANVGRLHWGSDWPHSEMAPPLPVAADLVDLLAAWVPDEAARRRICVDNAAELYFH